MATECTATPNRGHPDALNGFQANLAFPPGAGSAGPDHATAHGMERVLVQDDFDNLAAPEVEITAQAESEFRGIENQAGQPFLVAVEVDDQTGTRFGKDALGAPALGNGKAGHGSPLLRSSVGAFGIVAFRNAGSSPRIRYRAGWVGTAGSKTLTQATGWFKPPVLSFKIANGLREFLKVDS